MTSESSFPTPEGLRLLLVRLHYSGPRAWEDDPEASELMGFATRKYGALARKHGLEPAGGAAAARSARASSRGRAAI